MPQRRVPTDFYRSAPPAFKRLKFVLNQDIDIFVTKEEERIPYLVG